MPLSEQDRRRLHEIEQSLEMDDPDLVAAFTPARVPPVQIALYGLMFVAGCVVLVGGLVTTHAYPITGGLIGVAGAVSMVVAAGRLGRQLRRAGRWG